MQLVFIVLNKTECLKEILMEFYDAGIKGATVIETSGMARCLNEMEELKFLGSLNLLLDPEHRHNKTIFLATEDNMVKKVSEILNRVTGGLHLPDTGVMFAVPISYAEGFVSESE